MGDTYTIENVRIFSDVSIPALNSEWDVYVSTDAVSWTQIIDDWDINGSKEQWYVHEADMNPGTSGQYIKIVGKRVSGPPGVGYDWTLVNEFEFLGS